MTDASLFLYIAYSFLFVLSGILLFFGNDTTTQGMGYLTGIATIVALLGHFFSELLGFAILICSVFLFIIFSIHKEDDDAHS